MKLKTVNGVDVDYDEPEAVMPECQFETETRKIETCITNALTALCVATDDKNHPQIANAMSVHLLHVAMCLRYAAVVEAAEQSLARVVH